jgi:thiamine-monophosphate kinase
VSELELLRWIRARLPRRDGRVVVDSGDDAAVLRLGRGPVVFKIDSVLEGVHFDRRTARPEDIGHKAMARPLSDVAAMGATPTFALAAMMIPREARASEVRRVILGMERTARRFGVAIVGGDLASHAGGLALSVALLGEMRGGSPLRRSGARAGDVLAVTGALGGSRLGKHLRFVPRVREAREIRRRFRVRAMIDLSDGLLRDLGHLCEAGGVGAVLEEARIPISAAARTMARRDGRSPLDHALADGEDYELLFALPAEEGPALERARLGRVIGRVERRPGLRLVRRDGGEEILEPRGWEHRFGP